MIINYKYDTGTGRCLSSSWLWSQRNLSLFMIAGSWLPISTQHSSATQPNRQLAIQYNSTSMDKQCRLFLNFRYCHIVQQITDKSDTSTKFRTDSPSLLKSMRATPKWQPFFKMSVMFGKEIIKVAKLCAYLSNWDDLGVKSYFGACRRQILTLELPRSFFLP